MPVPLNRNRLFRLAAAVVAGCLVALCLIATESASGASAFLAPKSASGDFSSNPNFAPRENGPLAASCVGSNAPWATTSAPGRQRWLSPDPLGHAGSLSLYDYCDNDPLNVFDPDGRLGKGGGAAGLDIGIGLGTAALHAGAWQLAGGGVGTANYLAKSAFDAIAGTNFTDRSPTSQIHRQMFQDVGNSVTGLAMLAWNGVGSIGYGGALAYDAIAGTSSANALFGAQWAGMQQTGAAFSGGEGNSLAYRIGYTTVQIASIFLPIKGAKALRAANSGVPRVRHYTSPEGMAGIKADGAVNPARGGGVHVETGPPFGPARTGAAETGAYGNGAYVEFDAPGPMRPTNVGPRKTAVIPTDTPLPITDLNPTFKTVPWWKFWAR